MTPLPRLQDAAPLTVRRRTRGWIVGVALAAVAVAVAYGARPSQAEDTRPATPPTAVQEPDWSDAVIRLFSEIPVQDGGRIKPFSTWAKFTLLEINYKSSCKTAAGEKRSAVEWMLDTLFFPEVAKDYPIFRVENDEVIADLGLKFDDKKKSDRYSYNELVPGRTRLFQQYGRLHGLLRDEKVKLGDMEPVDQGLVGLGNSVGQFENLMTYLDFARPMARSGLHRAGSAAVHAVLGVKDATAYSDLVAKAHILVATLKGDDAAGLKEESSSIQRLLSIADALVGNTQRLGVFPPTVPEEREWSTPWHVLRDALEGKEAPAAHVAAIRGLELMTANVGNPARFEDSLREYRQSIVSLAEERGEYDKVPLEVSYYRLDPFYKSMWLYILAFLLVAFSWFKPGWKPMTWTILGLLAGAFVLHVTGITMRSILRERPPVSTLYDTIVFVSAVAVLACFITERINRQHIALAIAPIVGALGLFMAQGYEELNRQDTLPQLQAVLDTNFWLATHVVCITIGYSAGLLAGVLAHVHVLGRAFGLKSGSSTFYLTLGRMLYGTLCFGLLFSVVGTILGGVWANDSWGRFWGWDPKENGALMICIWQVMVLHARMAGLVRGHGMAMMAVFGTVVIVFSWWHVNLLGIGLHAYGFTEGVMDNLKIFYAVEGAVLMTGGLWWLQKRFGRSAA